ncbi:MAG: HD domain-containing protein [Candidatus Woesebacteria bacterium]|jgi:uncharacterized protein
MNDRDKKILLKLKKIIKKRFINEATGHDWFHMERVLQMAVKISEEEKPSDIFVLEAASLLHDIADYKFSDGDEKIGLLEARRILQNLGVDEKKIKHVCQIIDSVSFKGLKVKTRVETLEGKIVHDADRLDSIGALGIARTFAYGGRMARILHDPRIKPVKHSSFEDYKKKQSTTINHFYEKLLYIKNTLYTDLAKNIAQSRHDFMLQFLEKFYKEWDSKE